MSTRQDKFLARLDSLTQRYDEVSEQMGRPETSANSALIVKLAKEHASLGRIVGPYRAYLKVKQHLAETDAILADAGGDAEFKELAEAERPELAARAEEIMEGLIDGLLIGQDAEVDSLIMEVRAGTGGDEAALFARDLFEMYSRFAAAQGFKVEVIEASPNNLGGFKEVIFAVKGAAVFTYLGYEGGGHRVQRVPVTEQQGRVHTSAATVAVLPEVEETELDINWDKDVLEHVARSSGPGGQNVNKVESAIKLEHIATGITVAMQDEKSQHKNRAKARRLMASRVKAHYEAIERAKRDSTRKSMIGSGDRSERIRTYNFPQNRCTDHRVNENYPLDRIMGGDLGELIAGLRKLDRQQRLETAVEV